jgi:hypothetical protein
VWDDVYGEAINSVQTNKFHKASFSVSGHEVISCITVLNDNVMLKCKLKEKFVVVLCDSCKHTSLAQMKESIFSKYHHCILLQLSSLILSLECKFEFSDNIVKTTILELCQNIINLLIKRKQSVIHSEVSNTSLSESDQEILMYISGYILHALQKLGKRFKSSNYQKMTVLINNVLSVSKTQSPQETFVSKFKKWTTTLDRGGLTMPKDDFFLLIRNMELVVKSHVHGSVVSKDILLRSVCSEKMMMNVNVKYF